MKYIILICGLLGLSSCNLSKRTGKEQVISQSAEFSAGWALFSIKASFSNTILNKTDINK